MTTCPPVVALFFPDDQKRGRAAGAMARAVARIAPEPSYGMGFFYAYPPLPRVPADDPPHRPGRREARPGEPPAGPAVGDGVDRDQARRDAATRAEAERTRPLREAVEARDQADLTRAGFERDYRPGPLAANAKEDFQKVVAAYELATQRPITSPEVLQVVVNAHLRLAGAYQYVGQFDKAVAQAKKAADAATGTPGEVEATYEVGLIYLQALHNPQLALAPLKRAQERIVATIKDPNEQAKWNAATSEAIARCQREAREK